MKCVKRLCKYQRCGPVKCHEIFIVLFHIFSHIPETLYINLASCDFKIILYFCVDPFQKDPNPPGLYVTAPKPWVPHTDR